MKKRAVTGEIGEHLLDHMAQVKGSLDLSDEGMAEAWAGVEFFCAVALRVLARTNPSKIRQECVTVSIQTLIPRPPGN